MLYILPTILGRGGQAPMSIGRTFYMASSRMKAKSKKSKKSNQIKVSTVDPTTSGSGTEKGGDEKVVRKSGDPDRPILLEVKKKVLELLEEIGPISQRKIYDNYLKKLFPQAPFNPNPPIRPLWHRAQYTPEEEKSFLIMNRFKKRLIRSLTHDGTVAVMTVDKIRHLIVEIDDPDSAARPPLPDTTPPEVVQARRAKMLNTCQMESEKTFVWIKEDWVKLLKKKYLKRAQNYAILHGETPPTRFKAA